jgi:hypothetical protein
VREKWRHFGRPEDKCPEGIRMDKDLRKTGENKSDSTPLGVVIEEVIQSIETVDRKIAEFFAIHGTDLQIVRETQPNFRRGK